MGGVAEHPVYFEKGRCIFSSLSAMKVYLNFFSTGQEERKRRKRRRRRLYSGELVSLRHRIADVGNKKRNEAIKLKSSKLRKWSY